MKNKKQILLVAILLFLLVGTLYKWANTDKPTTLSVDQNDPSVPPPGEPLPTDD